MIVGVQRRYGTEYERTRPARQQSGLCLNMLSQLAISGHTMQQRCHSQRVQNHAVPARTLLSARVMVVARSAQLAQARARGPRSRSWCTLTCRAAPALSARQARLPARRTTPRASSWRSQPAAMLQRFLAHQSQSHLVPCAG